MKIINKIQSIFLVITVLTLGLSLTQISSFGATTPTKIATSIVTHNLYKTATCVFSTSNVIVDNIKKGTFGYITGPTVNLKCPNGSLLNYYKVTYPRDLTAPEADAFEGYVKSTSVKISDKKIVDTSRNATNLFEVKVYSKASCASKDFIGNSSPGLLGYVTGNAIKIKNCGLIESMTPISYVSGSGDSKTSIQGYVDTYKITGEKTVQSTKQINVLASLACPYKVLLPVSQYAVGIITGPYQTIPCNGTFVKVIPVVYKRNLDLVNSDSFEGYVFLTDVKIQ
jgi:hypothetical protein